MADIFPYLFLLGRIVVGVYFIFNGLGHFMNINMLSQYVASKGVPASKFMVAVTGVMLLIGGITILTGVEPLVGAWILIIFLFPTSIILHNFWAIEDQQMKMVEMANFTKNMALIGFLLMIFAIPLPWPFTLF